MDNTLQKIANKGTFKAYDLSSDSLTVTIPQYDQDTGVKQNVEANLNLSNQSDRITEIDTQIAELRKEKSQAQAIIDRFKVQVDTIKNSEGAA